MAKRKKGMSLEEKRAAMLGIFHDMVRKRGRGERGGGSRACCPPHQNRRVLLRRYPLPRPTRPRPSQKEAFTLKELEKLGTKAGVGTAPPCVVVFCLHTKPTSPSSSLSCRPPQSRRRSRTWCSPLWTTVWWSWRRSAAPTTTGPSPPRPSVWFVATRSGAWDCAPVALRPALRS